MKKEDKPLPQDIPVPTDPDDATPSDANTPHMNELFGEKTPKAKPNSGIPNKQEDKIKTSIAGRLGTANRINEKYKMWFSNICANLLEAGMDKNDIETLFGGSERALDNQTNKNAELKKRYEDAVARIQPSLVSRMLVQAIGYDYEESETNYEYDKKTKQWEFSRKKVSKRHQPGNATMMMEFLYNRFPDFWKKSQEIINRQAGYDSDPGQRNRKIIETLGREILEANTDSPETEHNIQG